MGAVSSIVQSVSDVVTDVGRAVTSSPIAQAAITVGGAAMGVPPAITAAALGVNQAANTGSIAAGLTTGLLSNLGGNLANSSGLSSTISGALTPAATGSGLSAASAGAGTGLQAGGTIGLGAGSIGSTAATNAAANSLGSSLSTGLTGAGLAGAATLAPSLGVNTGVSALGTGTSVPGLSVVPTTTPSSMYDLNALTSGIGTGLGGLTSGIGSGLSNLGSGINGSIYDLNYGLNNSLGGLTSGIGSGLSNLGSGLSNFTSGIGSGLNTLTGGLTNGLSSLSSNLGNILSQNGMLANAANIAAGQAQADAAKQAAQTQADAQIQAAKIAADAAKFKPIGVTTGFGSSNFGYDTNGNLISAGYNLTPEMKAQRDALLAQSGGLLTQAGNAQTATAPLADAAQRAMTLGNQYLAANPQDIAAKYMADQQALLAAGNNSALTNVRDRLNATGRTGFSIGGGTPGMTASNPELQAYYNALTQQNLQLAANATQGGMDYAKFGSGMAATGGNLLSGMYGTQAAAYDPYSKALGGATTVEGLGQDALTQGISLGNTLTAANAKAGGLLSFGMQNAAQTMAPANAYSPWANFLGGVGQATQNYTWN